MNNRKDRGKIRIAPVVGPQVLGPGRTLAQPFRRPAIGSSSRPILRPSVSGAGPASASVRVRVTRDLGLFDITMAALGAMVGAAIFLLGGSAYAVAGPLILFSLGVAALIAALPLMSYA